MWIKFDDLPSGTRIDEEYASQGVHFSSDYFAFLGYRNGPQITAVPAARSAPNVLVNTACCDELFTSANTPLVLRFDQPISGVGMHLGLVGSCSSVPTARVTLLDCLGNIRGTGERQPSASFYAPIEVLDPSGSTRMVVIDYGNSQCPEAIDDLAIQFSGKTCSESSPPTVQVTSHVNDQIVASPSILLRGIVRDNSGAVARLKINGSAVGLTPQRVTNAPPYYAFEFQHAMTLGPGANPVTLLAWDNDQNKGGATLTLHYGAPTTVTLAEFHLTQRGVLLTNACDVDEPLVAGKSTLFRIRLDARTANGTPTYVTSVQMRIWRKAGSGESLVETLDGTTYSPYLTLFQSPTEMAAVHFWVPGDKVDPAGEYRFDFQPYVGLNPVGPPLGAGCGGLYYTFTETRPIRLLILPVEAGLSSPVLAGTDHVRNAMAQLASVARTFPVRDGVSGPWWGFKSGVIYSEAAPFLLGDGSTSFQQQFPAYYASTGWTYRFIDKDPGGLLRRADDQVVIYPTLSACDTNDHKFGGRIVSTQTFTLTFDPALGIFRGGAHPSWEGAKHATPMDEDHDGDIDNADLGRYIAEFFDQQTSSWQTNLANYDAGETFRFFRDTDANNCNQVETDPQADIRMLWEHGQRILTAPAMDALSAYNTARPGTAQDAQFVSLWFPKALTAFDNPEFGSYGPGQGDNPGPRTWIVVRDASAMPHELGHNLGEFEDLYRSSIDPADDDLVTKEKAMTVYIDSESVAPWNVFAAMGADRPPDRVVHYKPHYKTLFDKLKVSAAGLAGSGDSVGPLMIVSGWINARGTISDLQVRPATDIEPTPPAPNGPYKLIFGSRGSVLLEWAFAPASSPPPPEGFESWPVPHRYFRVIAPLPIQTTWVEVRRRDELLARRDRSARNPVIQLLSPNGRESYGPSDTVLIRWTASDADGDPLRHSLYYSPDGGERWITLAADISGDSFRWNIGHVPGTPAGNGRIRIVTSDGFNQAEDQSDGPFSVAGKPPWAVILRPAPGQVFLTCRSVGLEGLAADPEGRLTSIQWRVDGALVAANLRAAIPLPSPGRHVVELRAIDEQGLVGVHQTPVFIEADSDCDGMSDDFEEMFGFEPSSAADSGQDDDGDGLRNFEEAWFGTHPRLMDTDGDGYTDGLEVRVGTDPTAVEKTPNPSFEDPLLLDCGGSVAHLDDLGRHWVPDEPWLAPEHPPSFTFQAQGRVSTSRLTDPHLPQDVLLTERWRDGDLHYRIPAPNGSYAVTLYFSENYAPAVNPALGGTGCADCRRLFDIQVEDQWVKGYDAADAALGAPNDGRGALFTATELAFDVALMDHVLDIQLIDLGPGNPPQNASIKAIQVRRAVPPTPELNIHLNRDRTVRLSWPGDCLAVLEQARSVTGRFTELEARPRLEGQRWVVDLEPASASRYYRLRLR